MRIGLIPLDERPVNTRYPTMIAAIAGAELALPPVDVLSRHRVPARWPWLEAWLRSVAPDLDALIVSIEMLGYGGLIASRITDEPPSAVLQRLDVLREIRQSYPALPIYGFNVITRVSNADSAIEEPLYWQQSGTRLYRLSQVLDRRAHGQTVDGEIQALEAEIPAEQRRDFLTRRARNHTVNLAALQLLAEGVLDLLVLSSDDTSPFGLPSREKRWLVEWAERLDLDPLGRTRDSRLLMYPGADEVGCALLARALNTQAGWTPCVEVRYAMSGGEQIVAPYEDGPVHTTVERQIRAIGGTIVSQDGDLVLAVNPPVASRAERPADDPDDPALRLPQLAGFVDQIGGRAAQGQPVIIADVAYPNGADPLLIEMLRASVDLTGIVAYGAWNTAGNTIGTALAQGCAARLIASDRQRAAQQRFLAHRFAEDWGYQHVARPEARAWLRATFGVSEPTPETEPELCARIEQRLDRLLRELPGLGTAYRIAPGSVRLPWQRTFEVDFDLNPRGTSE